MQKKFLPRLKRTFYETATSASFWFPLGNTFLAIDKAEPTGIALMAATTAFTTLARARASWNKTPSRAHFNILSAVNACLAVSVLYHGVDQNGLQHMMRFATAAARESWFAAFAYAGWSYCHRINGQVDKIRMQLRHENRSEDFNETKRENKRNIMNVFASASVVNFDPRQLPFLGLSLLRSVFNRESDSHFDGTVSSYLKKHVTSTRIMALKFAVGVGILCVSKPFEAAAQGCWMIGQWVMDPERNRDFIKDSKAVILGREKVGHEELHPKS